jgi:hypothetical protein
MPRANSDVKATSKAVVLATYLPDLLFKPEDEGSMFLQNISKLLPDCMALHPRRQYSLCEKMLTTTKAAAATLISNLTSITVTQAQLDKSVENSQPLYVNNS